LSQHPSDLTRGDAMQRGTRPRQEPEAESDQSGARDLRTEVPEHEEPPASCRLLTAEDMECIANNNALEMPSNYYIDPNSGQRFPDGNPEWSMSDSSCASELYASEIPPQTQHEMNSDLTGDERASIDVDSLPPLSGDESGDQDSNLTNAIVVTTQDPSVSRQSLTAETDGKEDDEIMRVEDFISQLHKPSMSWHTTLNNHASMRPKEYGGPLVPSVSGCKQYERVRADSSWRCHLWMPSTCEPNDGEILDVVGVARTKDEASENACRRAMAVALWKNPSVVVLRPCHWQASVSDILQGLPCSLGERQVLPARTRSRAVEVDADRFPTGEKVDRVSDILRDCLIRSDGTFDPAHINHRRMGFAKNEERVYSRLNKLLRPGELKPFIENDSEFAWQQGPGKGMLVTWGKGSRKSIHWDEEEENGKEEEEDDSRMTPGSASVNEVFAHASTSLYAGSLDFTSIGDLSQLD
jgi:hypothetical protein